MSVYNEVAWIRDAVESVLWCDRIIVFDGAWEGWQTAHPNSNDGTLEVLSSLSDENDTKLYVLTSNKFYGRQKKIEVLLGWLENNTYFLLLDGDEVLEGEHQKLKSYIKRTKLPLYTIPLYHAGDDRAQYVPRIIKKTPAFKWTFKHVALTNNFTPNYTIGRSGRVTPDKANLDFLAIIHYSFHKSQEREEKMKRWINNNVNT